MNILLINPWIYDFAAFDLWSKPLGLLYVGSFLEHHGYRIRLIDCMDRNHPSVSTKRKDKKYGTGKFYEVEIEKPACYNTVSRTYKRFGIPVDAFEADLAQKPRPDIIVITSIMTYWYPGVCEVIRRVKSRFPGIPVILGGIYATLCKEHALRHTGADYIVSGNGLIDTLGIADSLCGKKRDYTGIDTTLDALPLPAYHLYPTLSTASVITSLGCPLACRYCASRILQPHFIEREVSRIYNEIMYYHTRYQINDIAFYDDALLINPKKRFIPLAQKLITEKCPFRLHTPNGIHVRAITREIAALLFQANVTTIRLSFESSATTTQARSSFKTTNDELRRAHAYLHKAGYKNTAIEVYVMIGLPGQDIAEIEASIGFVHDLGIKVKLTQYSPIPHTPDFHTVATHYPTVPFATEPLLHNNSTFSLMANPIGEEQLQKVKARVKKLNERL